VKNDPDPLGDVNASKKEREKGWAKYHQQHFGCYWCKAPLMPTHESRVGFAAAAVVENPSSCAAGTKVADRNMLDILHLVLREVGRGFHATIREMCLTEEEADAFNKLLKRMGITLDKKVKKRRPGQVFNDDKAMNLIGEQCVKIIKDLALGDTSRVLSLVLPPLPENADDPANVSHSRKRERVKIYWSSLLALISCLTDTKLKDTTANRVAKSETLKQLCKAYVAAYKDAVFVGSKTQFFPPYLHYIDAPCGACRSSLGRT